MERVLGLDLGTNSIGWAVIDVPEDGDGPGATGSVVAMGSRIFAEGAEADGKALSTKAKERRQARSMRRQVLRRAKRRRRIREELCNLGLLPADEGEFENLMAVDPAELQRRSGAGEVLSLREIGRVVYWFSSRRGFLSLRSGGGDLTDDDDDRAVRNRYRNDQVRSDTGEILERGQENLLVDFLRAQAAHHPGLLTDEIIFGARGRLSYPVRPIRRDNYLSGGSALEEFGIHGLVFFQRSVYWDEGTIGRCSIDPNDGGNRALRADRLAQKYRVWKTVIDLRVGGSKRTLGKDERTLDEDERQKLFDALMSQKTMAFSKLRKVLGLDPDCPINFERSEREALVGNETDAVLRSVVKDSWDGLSEPDRDRLASLLLGNADERQLSATLRAEFGLSSEQVEKALGARFPAGRAAFGRRTLRRLLEVIPSSNTELAAIKAAGFDAPEVVRAGRTVEVGDITNPLVRKTLGQLSKLLPALASTFGRDPEAPFDVVRIELTRDVRQNYRTRQETNKRQRGFEKANAAARAAIDEFAPGKKASRDRIRRHRLWKEQGEACLYCGQPISAVALFGSGFELDHILPRSRTLDDSLANLALVHADENLDKGDRTPVEWKGLDGAHEIAERAKGDLPKGVWLGKVRRILNEEVDADVPPAALLVETGYINNLARDFVRQVLDTTVQVSSGRLTAALRYRLGLEKDDDDHRRHAQDAAMVALCDLRTARALANHYRRERDHGIRRSERYGSFEPWVGLRTDLLDHYGRINVSHVAKGKVSGQLHKETHYGKVESPHLELDHGYAFRRPLSAINTPGRLAEVADPAVRAALVADLERRGLSAETGPFKFDAADPPKMPDGTVVNKARCHKNYPGNRIIRPDTQPKTAVAMENNYVGFVYENTRTGRWRVRVVQRFDAFKLRNVPLRELRTRFAQEDERFLFSATIGTTLQLTEGDTTGLFHVKNLDSDGRRFDLRPLNQTAGGSQNRYGASALQKANASKVVVLPSGEVRTARD